MNEARKLPKVRHSDGFAQPLVLAIDSGTSSCKVLAIDANGRVASETAAPHTLIQPQAGWAEQEPATWWRALTDATRSVPPQIRSRIACVTVTSQREGLVPVDEAGTALANCIIWLDRRGESELRTIEEKICDRQLFELTGLRLDATFSLPRLLWLRTHQSRLLKQAAWLLQPADYLVARLTGRFVSDLSFASRTALLDIRRRTWSQHILDTFAIDRAQLPELVEPGALIGALRQPVADALGLPRTAVVIAGAGDQQAMAIGTGAFRPHTAAVSMGTSTSIVRLIDQPILDPQMRVLCNCSALPGGWDLQAPIWTTGALLEWLKGVVGVDESDLISEALAIRPGADDLIAVPHFIGAGAPHWHVRTRGGFLGLNLIHTRAHLARAVLEAVAYEIRTNLAVSSELTDRVADVTLTGRLVRGDGVLRLFASMLGVPVAILETSSNAALGAYANAAVTMGFAASVEDALAHVLRRRRIVEPDPEQSHDYAALFADRAGTLEQQIQAFPSPARLTLA